MGLGARFGQTTALEARAKRESVRQLSSTLEILVDQIAFFVRLLADASEMGSLERYAHR